MCGIFCIYCRNTDISYQDLVVKTIRGLKTLEYRGYDSAGLYLLDKEGHNEMLMKSIGNVNQLNTKIPLHHSLSYQVSISHTRWATHGIPCEKNTHPHGCYPENEFVVVHNGIITNYVQLKIYLYDNGFECQSDTDTEVIPLLYLKFWKKHGQENFYQLTNRVINVLKGAFAFCVVSKKFPSEMMIVRKDSPIIIGETDTEIIISSDVNGISSLGIDNAIFLKNNDIVWVSHGVVHFYNDNVLIQRSPEVINVFYQDITKGSYNHFMEKEIFEQPQTISMTFNNRIVNEESIFIHELIPHVLKFENATRILMVACGSSWNACMANRNHFEKIFPTKMIQIENACNLIDRKDFFICETDIIIFLSQSGETSDTLTCLRQLKMRCPLFFACGITNMKHSSLARECDVVVYNNIGNEIGVASTKSYTSQILLLAMVGLQFCKDKMYLQTAVKEILELPDLLSSSLSTQISDDLIQSFQNCKNILVLGRNEHYATALETSLKLKEISYIHSEGLMADELKHGPLAMIENSVKVIVISSNDPRMSSTIQQLYARNAKMVILSDNSSNRFDSFHISITNFLTISVLRTIVDIVPCQLLAYRIATQKQINVDQPRHLAKSVTVSD
jgi:glucosamine--fructose-6-phosphate aminotransferase (isomerizing)